MQEKIFLHFQQDTEIFLEFPNKKKNETFLRGKWLHPPGPIKNTNGKTEDEEEISRLFSQRSVKNKQKLAKVEKNKKETNSLEGNCYSFT
jgi:hypothetical protein